MKIVFFLISGLLCLLVITAAAFAKEQVVDSQRFLGTWKLVNSVHTDGTPNLLFGENPIGYIIYTKAGIMSAHLMRRERVKFHSDNVSEATAEEAKNLLSDYYGYTGAFKIDAKQKIITHYPSIHSLPNSVGKPLQRSYRFEGKNRLYLTTIGDKQESVFTWERIKEN